MQMLFQPVGLRAEARVKGPPDLPVPIQEGRFDLSEVRRRALRPEPLRVDGIDDLAVAPPTPGMCRHERVPLVEAGLTIVGPKGDPLPRAYARGRDRVVIRVEPDAMPPALQGKRQHDVRVIRHGRERDQPGAFFAPHVDGPPVRRAVDPLVRTI